ncbi:alpha/beta hydrolase [Nocardioides sp. R1-1]|uniref:alpha/beta hydrolase n=1 Tax=Nocardioides sp. R1-1 TaxID=3383502 RepID=UPI0038CF714B
MTTPRHSGFATVLHPDAYAVDWPGFYERALKEGQGVRARFAHSVERYGSDDEHQVLNVFRPAGAVGAPVLVFFHGGRWREGHPDYYDALAAPWVEAGVVFVSAGYRLEAQATKRQAVDDAAAAVRRVVARAADWGGDPARLSLAGHSAGAHLAAMVAATAHGQALLRDALSAPVRSLVGVSGVYDIRADESGADGEALSPTLQVAGSVPETVVAYGVPELNAVAAPSSFFSDQGEAFASALRAHGATVAEVPLPDHDHIRTAQAFGTAGSPLFERALRAVTAVSHEEVAR